MKITLADNHCHLSKEYYPENEKLLEELENNLELEYVISMGVNFDNNQELLELKKSYGKKFLKIGCGLHPEEVISLGKYYKQELDRVISQIRENVNQIDIIGEIGIDFYYPNSREFEKVQVDTFRSLIQLAKELNKPVSIHARESFDEIMKILDDEIENSDEFKGYLHCFTGNFEQGMFFIEKGFKLGIGGIVTYKSGTDLLSTIKELLEFYEDKEFDDMFGLETDAPYLTPNPLNRSEQNNPKNVEVIAEFLEEKLN